MALPARLEAARLTNASAASSIDDALGDLEKDLASLLGVTIDTDVLAALFIVAAAGLHTIIMQDAGAPPDAVGQIRRHGDDLLFHTGAAVKNLSDPFTGLASLTLATSLILSDAGADPTVAGEIRRVGATFRGHTGAGVVDLHFPPGTQMVFRQATPPTGWTRVVDAGNTDSLIRLVLNNETPSAGGSWITATDPHVLTEAQMPPHVHGAPVIAIFGTGGNNAWSTQSGRIGTNTTDAAGSGEAHAHSIGGGAWRPKYTDCIVAAKD